MDMPFDQKMDFCWPITILGLFQNLAILGNISKKFKNIFCMSKIGIHTKFYGNSSKIECFTGQKPRPPPAMALTV